MTVPYVDERELTYALEIHNSGRFGVTIVTIDSNARSGGLLRTENVDVSRHARGGYTVLETSPMRPFALKGGGRRAVVLHLRMVGCELYSPGFSATHVAVSIRLAVLGEQHTMSVPLPVSIAVTAPAAEHCPQRQP